MKYTIILYQKGVIRKTTSIEAKSAKSALRKMQSTTLIAAELYKVIGSTVRRYDVNGKLVKAEPKIYKAVLRGMPCILALFGNLPEILFFQDVGKRDEVYKQCITSISAEYANPKSGLNDITAYFGGMSGIKNGSTSKKTSNGYVIYATRRDEPTLTNTAVSSGRDSAEDSESRECSVGSTASRSKLVLTSVSNNFYATVKLPKDVDQMSPLVTPNMKEMNGQVIVVKRVKFAGKDIYQSPDGYFWNPLCLDFYHVNLYVRMGIPRRTALTLENGSVEVTKKSWLKGEPFFNASLCDCGCNAYQVGKHYLPVNLLTPVPPVVFNPTPFPFTTGVA